jgi:hypothetical protein
MEEEEAPSKGDAGSERGAFESDSEQGAVEEDASEGSGGEEDGEGSDAGMGSPGAPAGLSSSSSGAHAAPTLSAPLATSTPAKPVRLRPALRGVLKREATGHLKWEGSWGMDDSAFAGGIVSAFSYARVKVSEAGLHAPAHLVLAGERLGSDALRCGAFTGSFNMVIGGKSKRIPEKDVTFEFSVDETLPVSRLRVFGTGSNQFGQYTLEGTLALDSGELNVYREYKPLGVVAGAGPGGLARRASAASSASGSAAKVPPRARERAAPKVLARDSSLSGAASTSTSAASAEEQRQGRMRRAPSHLISNLIDDKVAEDLIRIKNALRDLMRVDRDGWFCHPVDAEALGLKNYREVVTEPMDLGTVLKRLENKEYTETEAVVEHVRLTFNNALKYNPVGHPVNTAARRLLQSFESSAQKLAAFRQERKRKRQAEGLFKRRKTGDEAGEEEAEGDEGEGGNEGSAAARKKQLASQRRLSGAPRGSSSEVADLQEQLQLMKDQLKILHDMQMHATGIKMMQAGAGAQHDEHDFNNDIISAPPPKPSSKKKGAPPAPEPRGEREFSYQDKRQLGADIHKLPPDMIEGVLQIIQESGAAFAQEGGDEVELDIDALDTPTLRKLQKHVKRCLAKAKGQTFS